MNLFLFSLLIGISWVEMQVGRAVAYHCLSSWTFNSNPSLRPSLRSLFRVSTWWPLSLSFRRGYFDPRGSHEPRRELRGCGVPTQVISIHEALASLDHFVTSSSPEVYDFDPRGSREPRQRSQSGKCKPIWISIHEALASLDEMSRLIDGLVAISIHEALAGLDLRLKEI